MVRENFMPIIIYGETQILVQLNIWRLNGYLMVMLKNKVFQKENSLLYPILLHLHLTANLLHLVAMVLLQWQKKINQPMIINVVVLTVKLDNKMGLQSTKMINKPWSFSITRRNKSGCVIVLLTKQNQAFTKILVLSTLMPQHPQILHHPYGRF
jgi:hypothetical protein